MGRNSYRHPPLSYQVNCYYTTNTIISKNVKCKLRLAKDSEHSAQDENTFEVNDVLFSHNEEPEESSIISSIDGSIIINSTDGAVGVSFLGSSNVFCVLLYYKSVPSVFFC